MSSPSTRSPRPSSCGEHIMPCDSTPRILPTLIVKGGSPGLAGSVLPGKTRGTLSPALKFCAPQTIWRSPLPSLTRQTVSLSALGCLSLVMTWATTTPSSSPPSFRSEVLRAANDLALALTIVDTADGELVGIGVLVLGDDLGDYYPIEFAAELPI